SDLTHSANSHGALGKVFHRPARFYLHAFYALSPSHPSALSLSLHSPSLSFLSFKHSTAKEAGRRRLQPARVASPRAPGLARPAQAAGG
ncbi:unnamed protein product, partial [Urochloa humidicola]